MWKTLGFCERLLAGMLLAVTSPVLVLSAVIVAGLSRRSPLIAHKRVGQGGRSIWVIKLRTMWNGDSSAPSFGIDRLAPCDAIPIAPKAPEDSRVTSRFASFCRRYSIDELPQLWHVVRGEMALVGPRPLTRVELDTYYADHLRELLAVRPGISGLWQISGRSRLSYRQRRRLDLFMIRKWSVSLYLGILIATLPRVLGGKDAW